ncbi:MAG TPA: glycosyltransferase [Syntrophales bacterium]|nr:glycosyltransferase [Syntrophales bacterium]HOL60014.1 glycosyltransferase [Syntrophales bacterium]HPO36153.1 glycosyltransferase [Syntrophales bacterium]
MISVVIPIHNEEANIPLLLARLKSVMDALERPYEIVCVDDGSTDRSLEMLLQALRENPNLKVVELTRNYGQHPAVMAGFSQSKGEIVITIDADLQNPPEEIPRLVKTMEEGNYEVVGTVRRARKDSYFRVLASKAINILTRRITGIKMSDWGCMLRAYRQSVVEKMVAYAEQATFVPALATVFAKRITEIEVAHEERHGGKTNYPLRKLINLQFDLVSSFSNLPLKVLLYGGIIMSFLGFAFGLTLIIARLYFGAAWAVQGVFTLFALLFFFIGMQFFALGVLGEYLDRIYREVRKRPSFVIQKVYQAKGEGRP